MKQSVYSVSSVNAYIKNMFTQDFMMNKIYVKGEISNCKYHPSGHIYFTLKEKNSVLNAVMFAGNRSGLTFQMKNGDNVIVLGSISVYERDGKYQMYAREILLEGAGLLFQQFEALKKELAEMGMFAPEYKQPIPPYIKTLGIVTASTGAAIRDIQNIAYRRNPYVQLILYPAIVQGAEAALSIVNGILALEHAGVDLIIIGRGGGSMEDLWAFNERIVAQAIFECSVPIIAAIGHETDVTIADFVADLRAPTPSAAAELAIYDVEQLKEGLLGMKFSLHQALIMKRNAVREKINQLEQTLSLLSPSHKLNEKRQYCIDLEQKLKERMDQALVAARHALAMKASQLEGLSPISKLSRGYAFVTDRVGNGVVDAHKIQPGDPLKIHLINGRIDVMVTEVDIDSSDIDKGEKHGKSG
jgi:exodeoxyribonuclease VII large subunit